jgi:1-acyl-sn-glycerol-3-phosphate acyltransferase
MKNKTTLIAVIISFYFWSSLFTISAILFPFACLIWLFTILFDKNRVILHQFTCWWSSVILAINPYWKTRITGKEKVERGKAYVMVSNHQSGADILVLFKLFIPFKWVSKKELFFVPFIGWNMALNGYISLNRSRGRSKRMMMDKAVDTIKKGNSLMIFPEGTRSRDGFLQPFKSGAFRLAMETASPILPIALKGTFHAIKKGGFIIHENHDIEAVILDPIPFEVIRDLDIREITEKVHGMIKNELGQ